VGAKPSAWTPFPPGPTTCGIGSLPHPNVDAALGFAFSLGIPTLPQLPAFGPKELMIYQTLEGLPGLSPGEGGVPAIDIEKWMDQATPFESRLEEATAHLDRTSEGLEDWEPSPESWRAWGPFLWELGERGATFAKIQIAGPLTCQWAVRPTDGTAMESHPRLTTQIFRLALLRARCMARRLKLLGVTPLLFLDEPSLFALSLRNPRHVLALQELRLAVQALQKEGAKVGIHCCSDTDWRAVYSVRTDVISFDTSLSLERVFGPCDEALAFLERGGRFALGVVPTTRPQSATGPRGPRPTAEELFEELASALGRATAGGPPGLAARILASAIYTPACGLALLGVDEAQEIGTTLAGLERLVSSSFPTRGRPEDLARP
jgi:hypothetical protein